MRIDYTRDKYLTQAAIATLTDRYLVEGETSPQDCFMRASKAFASNEAHAQRMYDYVSNRWLMYSTPILSNGGTKRGQPIACFGGYVDDSRHGITDHYTENAWLSSMGGGIGGYWGHIRSNGEKTSSGSSSSGIIPFIKVVDSMVLAFSQGGCYTPDAEVLTSEGFRKLKDLTYQDKVAQVEDDKTISFVTPLDIIEEDFNGDLYELKGRSTYLKVTSNHSMILERTVTDKGKSSFSGKLIKVRAELAKYHRDVRHHTAGYGVGAMTTLTPLDKLRLAHQADGREGYTNKEGLTTYDFRFTKHRKIDRLKSILDELGYPRKEVVYSDNVTRISIQLPFKLSKILSDEFNLDSMSAHYAESWIQELAEWDGSRKATYIKWSSTVEENAKFVQAVASLCGQSTHVTIRPSKGNRADLYNVGIRNSSYVGGDSLTMTNVGGYTGKVYCCLVPSGRLVVRQQGKVSICGNTRRGSYAAYLDISHPEILEFLSIRKPTGGDSNRKSLNLHNAVIISDEFMRKVTGEDSDPSFNLIDPHTGNITSTVNAKELWEQILTLRVETGEPYIMFGDTVNDLRPAELKQLGLKINQSNLCVAPETKILTSTGWHPIISLKDKEVSVWTGGSWSNVTIKQTGTNQELLRVTFSNGSTIECTPYHKFYVQNNYHGKAVATEAQDLIVGDKLGKWDLPTLMYLPAVEMTEQCFKEWYSQGFYSGDGNTDMTYSWLYSPKYMCKPYLVGKFGNIHPSSARCTWTHGIMRPKDYVPHDANTQERLAWLSGLLDADGTVVRSINADTLQLTSVNYTFLYELMLMLASMGVYSTIGMAREQGVYSMPDGKGGNTEYECQEIHRLCISTKGTAELLSLGLSCKRLEFREVQDAQRSATRQVQVVKVERTGRISDTYCADEPIEHKLMFNGIQTGNCSEITLPTSKDRTFVCCLSSLNLELFDEWKDTPIIDDLTEFLDNVLTYFIDTAPDSMSKAKRGAELGRDIGIGTLGWHSYLQSKMIPFDSVTALSHLNMIHKHIATCAYRASFRLGKERGFAQDTVQGDSPRRNTHLIAIAPNASSGIICGTSPSVEPWTSNIFTQKTLSGSFEIRNPHLTKLLEGAGLNTEEMWKTIRDNGGSISHIQELFHGEKDVFKTAAEIDQHWIIEQAGMRQKYIDQAQSINLFFNPIDGKISAKYLHDVHVAAWKKGLKTLYYLRSKAIRKADNIGAKIERQVINTGDCVSCEG